MTTEFDRLGTNDEVVQAGLRRVSLALGCVVPSAQIDDRGLCLEATTPTVHDHVSAGLGHISGDRCKAFVVCLLRSNFES